MFICNITLVITSFQYIVSINSCCKPPSYVPYKCTYVPYDNTFGASDQGQRLDM